MKINSWKAAREIKIQKTHSAADQRKLKGGKSNFL